MRRIGFYVGVLMWLIGGCSTVTHAGSYSINLGGTLHLSGSDTHVTPTDFITPYNATRCTSAGCSFLVQATYPLEISQDGFNPIFNIIAPFGTSPDGQLCLRVCVQAIKSSQQWADIPFSSCTSIVSIANQNAGLSTQVDVGTFIPAQDVLGAVCTPSSCRGMTLLFNYQRIPSASCPGSSSFDVDFVTSSPLWR